MGRSPCYHEMGLKKGPWTPEEDQKLVNYIQNHGTGVWRALPQLAGLNRCGKSCRLRWTNYLRPGIKRGKFSQEEEQTILNLHAILGNKWSAIASHLPGRTDNEVKNFWNINLKKKLIGYDPITHLPQADSDVFSTLLLPHLMALANKEFLDYQQWNHENDKRLQEEAFQLAKLQCLQHFLKMPQPSIIEANTNIINHLSSPQFENTISSSSSSSSSLVGARHLHFVNDSISFSQMPALETPFAYEQPSSKDVVQPLNDNMVISCNDSTTWPELILLEDPLFNEISKF